MKRLLSIIALTGIFSSAAWAIQVAPTYQMFQVKPGEKASGQMIITNTENFDLNVVPSVKDWQAYPSNKNVKAADWLKLKVEQFTLKPNESKVVPFTVQPPKSVKGEVMGMVTFLTKGPDQGMISFQLSVAMYATVEGTEKVDPEVRAISIKISSNTDVGLMIGNNGNVHLRPYGLVEIWNDKKQLVSNVVFTQGDPVFPGVPRIYYSAVKNFRLPDGRYEARVMLEDADRNMKYKVEKKEFSVKNGVTVQ